MFQIDRQKKIYEHLLNNENATVNELAEICNVATMTIRRDLDKMESDGLITRVFGGAVINSNIVSEVKYEEKEKSCIEEKKSIAEFASSLVPNGGVVILDSGTTCMEIAKCLVERRNLKIITTDILIAAYLMNYSNIEVYCTGGKIQSEVGACIDSTAVEYLKSINADVCFMGASAINENFMLSTSTIEKAQVKKAMIASSQYTVLVADESKFYKRSFANVCNLSVFDLVVANKNILEELKRKLMEDEINLKLV